MVFEREGEREREREREGEIERDREGERERGRERESALSAVVLNTYKLTLYFLSFPFPLVLCPY